VPYVPIGHKEGGWWMETLDFPVRFEDFPEGGMVLRTEHRVSRMLVLVRIATSFFAYIPLLCGASWLTRGSR
jgi:hypothetical protein